MVFVFSILTEYELKSSVIEKRKLEFSCLVDLLQTKNITDEFFAYAIPIENSSDCDGIVNQYKLKIENFYYDTQNISTLVCEEIKENSFCNASIFTEKVYNKEHKGNLTSDQLKCLHLREETESLKFSQQYNSTELYDATKEKCENVSTCFSCIKEVSHQSDYDYESSMLHVMAANLTSSVIEFRIWQYFGVNSKVEKLLNDANIVRDKVVVRCNGENKCSWKIYLNLKICVNHFL